eukprot:Tamp_32958.p1 GENE.Tamp_32958~~Tamp_32958.p1  ORF type:complete len:175 (+),score=12.94 Tamp_32958:87-611(+)
MSSIAHSRTAPPVSRYLLFLCRSGGGKHRYHAFFSLSERHQRDSAMAAAVAHPAQHPCTDSAVWLATCPLSVAQEMSGEFVRNRQRVDLGSKGGESVFSSIVLLMLYASAVPTHSRGREAGQRLWAMSDALVDGHVLLPPRTQHSSPHRPSLGVLFVAASSALVVAALWCVILS